MANEFQLPDEWTHYQDPVPPGLRYRFQLGSASKHCCFEATVFDTTALPRPRMICECSNESDGEAIAIALNEGNSR